MFFFFFFGGGLFLYFIKHETPSNSWPRKFEANNYFSQSSWMDKRWIRQLLCLIQRSKLFCFCFVLFLWLLFVVGRCVLLIFLCHLYVHYQSKVFGYPQRFSFLIQKVLILMKQVKHHNILIYYTKYKSSSVTLTLALYTLLIHIHIQSNTNAQNELCCSDTNRLLISDFSSSTRGERHNSYYANPFQTRGAFCDV